LLVAIAMEHLVVAHLLDGRVIKGTTYGVAPSHPICQIRSPDRTLAVPLSELKALFFVKDLAGNPGHREAHAINAEDPRVTGARRLLITFRDGEELTALAPTYDPKRDFFFVLPADCQSNNVRILVNRAAVSSVMNLSTADGSRSWNPPAQSFGALSKASS
jgi:hypothetical protein